MPSRSKLPILLTTALLPLLAVPASPQTTSLVSISSEGGQGDQDSFRPALSFDGRWVAFHSFASNLVSGDANGLRDVYVHDHQLGNTERISLGLGGGEPDGHSRNAAISDDGLFVAYYSKATNLVPGDTNGTWDGFLYNRRTLETVRFSVGELGQQANGAVGAINALPGNRWPSMSADACYIAFPSKATNLVSGSTNGYWQIFVKDMRTGAVTLASPGAGGVGGNQNSYLPCMSADGRFVAFGSTATDLVPGDTNQTADVFVYELATGQTERVSISDSGAQGNGNSNWPSISGDGRLVAFHSYASNLVPGDSNGTWDVIARDRLAATTVLVSLSSSLVQGDGPSGEPSVSRAGDCVAFKSEASTFDSDDTNGAYDIYLRFLDDQETYWISTREAGAPPNLDCEQPFIAPGSFGGPPFSQRISFQTASDMLLPGDMNGAWDVFLYNHVSNCDTTIATYCRASTTSIPGCQAMISHSGTPNLAELDSFTIGATPAPGGSMGLCFFGLSGPAAIPFGTQNGLRCVAQPLMRCSPKWSGGTPGACDGAYTFSLRDLIERASGSVHPGAMIHAQIWFRDSGSTDGFGLSNAVWFQVCTADDPCGEGWCG